MARDVVFGVGASRYFFLQMTIKPGKGTGSLPQFLDSLLVAGNVRNLLVVGRTSVSTLVFSFGIEKQPLPGHLPIGPSLDDVGADPELLVHVVGEHGKGDDVERKMLRHVLQQFFDPPLSVVKVLSRVRVLAAQKSASDYTTGAVIHTDFKRRLMMPATPGT